MSQQPPDWAPPPPGSQPPVGTLPPPNAEKNNLGIWSLVLGILSLVFFGLFTGIPAIILGAKSRSAAAQGRANNGGMGTAGLVTGIIGTVLTSIGWFFIILALAAVGGAVDQASKSAASLGSTSTTISSSSAPASDTSSTTTDAGYTPKPSDFVLKPVIKKKECFGSAGCNITYRIDVTYNGNSLPSDVQYEVTYEVTGGDSGTVTNTFTVTGDSASVSQEEDISTASSSTKLHAKATAVEKLS